MNKNFMKSSVKALAVAVAALAFTSCSKDTFTEKDALNLELNRLRAQRTIDSIKTLQDRQDRNALLRYQRALDSLDRENAGGRVFYTVNVVSATSAGVSNGRTEESEGVSGAIVTTSQYGRTVSATTQSGIATFELRSGEATVAITAPAHTSADYTVNLTSPFSGNQTSPVTAGNSILPTVAVAKNGSTVYVGNVVPLFQISTDASQMATLRGRATIETDLTNATVELANAANPAIAVPVNVSATINTVAGSGFYERFLAKSGDFSTGGNQNGGTGSTARLGYITKIFYSPVAQGGGSSSPGSPIGRSAVAADGTYSMLLPASASGLPIRMFFDEIGANRTFFSTGGTVTRRFLYGPNVTPTSLPDGRDFTPNLRFEAFTTRAVVTASYTPEATATSYVKDVVYNNPNTGAGEKGIYFLAPTATISGGNGTGATIADGKATLSAALANSGGKLTEVASVKIDAGGSGYTANASVSFTRNDIKVIGTGNKGSGVSGGIANYIRVDNGGTGFVDVAAQTVNSGYTNFPPTITFTNAGTPFTPALPSPATAVAVTDKTVGTVAYVRTAGGGNFPIPVPTITPRYGTSQSIPGKDAANRDLFAANGTSGFQFNTAYVPFGPLTGATVGTTVITFDAGGVAPNVPIGDAAIPYTFVPTATLAFSGALVLGTTVIQTRAISLRVVVATDQYPVVNARGKIVRIEIGDGGAYAGTGIPNVGAAAGQLLGAGNTALAVTDAISISISENVGPNTGSFAFTATAFPTGTGIDNYVITDNTPTTGAGASIVSGAITIPDAVNPTGPVFTPLPVLTANQIDNMVAGSDFLVAFDKPTGEPKVQAWGIPVIDGTGRVVSVRILTGGAGYAQAQVNMTLVPNPFRGTANATLTLAPTDRTRAAAVFTSGSVALPGGKGIREDYLTDAKSYELGRPTTFSFIDFTVTNPGGGYAQKPSVVLFDGGLTFQAIAGALNTQVLDTDTDPAPTALTTPITNADLSTGSTTNDNRGDVVTMNNGGLARVGYPVNSTTPANVGRLYFNTDPKFVTGATLSVLVEDLLGAQLTSAFNTALNTTNGTSISFNTAGQISSVNLSSAFITSAAWPELGFNRPPTVTLDPNSVVSGTGATFQIDPAPVGLRAVSAGRWKIQTIRVTNGGSGFGRTNRFFNPATGNNVTATSTTGALLTGQSFLVFGGNEAANQTGLGAGNINSQFDAFNGVTYVRDIYYGTGRISQ